MAETWIAGYDFSQCAERALHVAADELSLNAGRLVLVHAYRRPHRQIGFELSNLTKAIKPLDDAEAIVREVIQGRLDAVAQRIAEAYPSLDVEARVVEGHPANCLVDVADEVDAKIIVMGTHGLTGLRKLLLGSVTQQLLSLSKRPVLVVRDPAEDDGQGEASRDG